MFSKDKSLELQYQSEQDKQQLRLSYIILPLYHKECRLKSVSMKGTWFSSDTFNGTEGVSINYPDLDQVFVTHKFQDFRANLQVKTIWSKTQENSRLKTWCLVKHLFIIFMQRVYLSLDVLSLNLFIYLFKPRLKRKIFIFIFMVMHLFIYFILIESKLKIVIPKERNTQLNTRGMLLPQVRY